MRASVLLPSAARPFGGPSIITCRRSSAVRVARLMKMASLAVVVT